MAEEAELQQKIWLIKTENPVMNDRAEAIRLGYGKEDMERVLELALDVPKEEAKGLVNQDGTLNTEHLRPILTKAESCPTFTKLLTDPNRSYKSEEGDPEILALLALMKKYREAKKSVPPIPGEEGKTIEKGFHAVAKLKEAARQKKIKELQKIEDLTAQDARETKDWQGKIDAKIAADNAELALRAANEATLKAAYDAANNYDVATVNLATEVTDESVTFSYDADLAAHQNQVGIVWIITKSTNRLNTDVEMTTCISTPTVFQYKCYNGSNHEIRLAFCHIMARNFLKEIKTNYLGWPFGGSPTIGSAFMHMFAVDMRRLPFNSAINPTAAHSNWTCNRGNASLFFSAMDNANRIDIKSPLFTSLLDPWVADQHAKGRTQKQMADELKTLRFDDLAVYF